MKTTRLLPLAILSLLVLPLGVQAKPDAAADKGGKPADVGSLADKAKDKKQDAADKTDEAKAKGEDAKTKAEDAGDAAKKKAELEGKKADQERKELGKGSETGQAKRAEHSRKWWKFWASDKETE